LRRRAATYLVLLAGLLAAACEEKLCELIGYSSFFEADAAFDARSAERLEVELCRESHCFLATVQRGSDAPTGSWLRVQVRFDGDGGPSSLRVSVEIPRDPAPRNGEIYSLRVSDSDTREELLFHEEAVTYQVIHHGSGACRQDSFHATFSRL
jgi:hypothetical protein